MTRELGRGSDSTKLMNRGGRERLRLHILMDRGGREGLRLHPLMDMGVCVNMYLR